MSDASAPHTTSAVGITACLPPYAEPTLLCSAKQVVVAKVAKVGMSMEIGFGFED